VVEVDNVEIVVFERAPVGRAPVFERAPSAELSTELSMHMLIYVSIHPTCVNLCSRGAVSISICNYVIVHRILLHCFAMCRLVNH
jgi:hypothetical protein